MAGKVQTTAEVDYTTLADPVEAARAAHLRYVSDTTPGITRQKRGEQFIYIDTDGKRVRDEKELKRIRSLVIPPAWRDVWICPHANGHLQATGRDARGRKQYRYHPRWRHVRDENKYGRTIVFAQALPMIRERVESDLSRSALDREKVLATIVRLLELTLIRVGNDEYARTNHHYGLTTLRDQHVDINGSHLHFHFRGKSGVRHSVDVTDRRLARIVKRCQDIPGQELFQYYDEAGESHLIHSTDVNDYLREITGEEFTAKDFRTWAGTLLAACKLGECEPCESESDARKQVVDIVKQVSERLGNTPSVCRKCYIHPAIIDSYMQGTLRDELARCAGCGAERLHPDEGVVLEMLRQRNNGDDA